MGVPPSSNHRFGGQLYIDGTDRIRFQPSESIEETDEFMSDHEMYTNDPPPEKVKTKFDLALEAKELVGLITNERGPDYNKLIDLIDQLAQ